MYHKLIEIDNSYDSAVKSGKWKNPGASLYDEILNSIFTDEQGIPYDQLLRETYLMVGKNIKNSPYGKTPFSRAECKYPHHVIKGEKLVLSIPGVHAAYARACQMGVYKGKIKEHLDKHMKELHMDIDFNEHIESNFNSIYDYINEHSGINLYENTEYVDYGMQLTECMEWIESFVHNDDFRSCSCIFPMNNEIYTESDMKENSAYTQMITRESPTDLFVWMDANIKYGYRSPIDRKIYNPGNPEDVEFFSNNYRLQSPTKLCTTKAGVCFDQTELERRWFSKHGIEHYVYYIDGITKDNQLNTHTFLLFVHNNHVWWFENAWFIYRGVHQYDSIQSALTNIIALWSKHFMSQLAGLYQLKESPKFEITINEYMNYAHSNPEIKLSLNESYNSFIEEVVINTPNEKDNNSENNNEENNDLDNDTADNDISNEQIPQDNDDKNKENENDDANTNNDTTIDIKPVSLPKQTDQAENNKNGVRRKKLYIAFIEWCKAYNNKNSFGSIFDKDIFHVTYPFIPDELRYFYRLANPIMCILSGNLTFFPVAELKKVNGINKHLDEMIIFAATENDLRIFSKIDKKVYLGIYENDEIKLVKVLENSFDLYIQTMINKGDILTTPLEESALVELFELFS